MSRSATSRKPRLTPVQREILGEFQRSRCDDRHVNPRYRRSAEALVRAGLLRPCIGGGWYEITEEGRNYA